MLVTIFGLIAFALVAATGYLVWLALRSDTAEQVILGAVISTHGPASDYKEIAADWLARTDIPLARREALIRAGITAQDSESAAHLTDEHLRTIAALNR